MIIWKTLPLCLSNPRWTRELDGACKISLWNEASFSKKTIQFFTRIQPPHVVALWEDRHLNQYEQTASWLQKQTHKQTFCYKTEHRWINSLQRERQASWWADVYGGMNGRETNKGTALNGALNIMYLLTNVAVTLFLISNFRCVLYVVCFLLGNSPSVWILYAGVSFALRKWLSPKYFPKETVFNNCLSFQNQSFWTYNYHTRKDRHKMLNFQ